MSGNLEQSIDDLVEGQHTPGPWLLVEGQWADHADGVGGFHVLMGEYVPKDGFGIVSARLLQYGDGFYPEDNMFGEVKANARLISAAPDLLEALRHTMDICRQYAQFIQHSVKAADLPMHPYPPEVEEAIETAAAAIAKAEGKP